MSNIGMQPVHYLTQSNKLTHESTYLPGRLTAATYCLQKSSTITPPPAKPASIANTPDAQPFAARWMPAEKMAQFNWKQQVPIMNGDSLIGLKVLPLQQPANQLTYLIVHANHGGFTQVVQHTIQYSNQNGNREPKGITSYNYNLQQQANWSYNTHITSRDPATLPTKIKQLSLVAPGGGSLPMITITATFDDGEIIPITPTTYVHVNGAFVASNGGASNSAFNYQNLDCLDPMAPPPNPGIGGTPTELNTEDYDVIDSVLYSRYNYPGMQDGFPWKWWFYDNEPEISPDIGKIGWENDETPLLIFDDLQFDQFIPGSSWPSNSSVLSVSEFVEYDRSNCFVLAKQQIRKKGYIIDAYGQNMFQTFSNLHGVNQAQTFEAIGYLHKALSDGIPVIAGVDYQTENDLSNPNPDKTTDHFVVIVGSGIETDGRQYFLFFDNATNYVSKGASNLNRLYYNPNTHELTGQTSVTYSGTTTKLPKYKVTQIRKSIKY